MEDFAREWGKSSAESRRFIVNLHGLGGIGKSKLLQQFLLRHAQEEMACKLDANFDELNDPLAVIKTILRKTRHADKQIEFEETQELIARFEKLVNEAAKSSGELPSAITKVLVKGAQVGGELLGGTETGKIVREVSESTADLVEAGLEKLASVWRTAKDEKDAKLLDAPVREITDKLVEEINGHCEDGAKFILAIDTYEKIPPSVDRWLLKDLLVEHEEQINFDLRLLIAGREPLTEVNRHWHDEWGGELLPFKVEPFTLEETSALLQQRRDIADPQIIEKIHNSTRGYPFWLDLWANSGIDAEHFFSTGHLQKIEDRLFEMFPNPKHQNWLRQAAFFYRFNQDLLTILIKDDVDKAFEWLVHQSSLVEGSEKYWKLHDLARKVILTNLRNRSQALLAEPAGKILQHFQQQLQDPWEKWRDLRFRPTLSEQDLQIISEIGYYQALAHAEITDDHLDMIIRTSDYSIKTARNLFNLAYQALNDCDSILPEKIAFAQDFIDVLFRQLKEEELEEKKSNLLKLSFSGYQKIILLNLIAKTYANKLKHVDKALSCLNEALTINPEYENAIMAKAELTSKTDAENASASVKIVLANNPNHEDALFRLGYCFGRLDKHVEAIDQYRRALEVGPEDAAIYNNIGWNLNKLGRYEEAIEQYKKTIEVDPKFAIAYNNIGTNFEKLVRHEEAIEHYKKAIVINPKYIVAYENLGNCLRKLGHFEEAVEQYKKVIDIDPKHAVAYNNWGNSLQNLNRHEEAIEKYKKAIDSAPKYALAYNNLGNSLFDLGRYKEAIEQYKNAIEIDSRYATAYSNWGVSLYNLRRFEEALEQYKKAIDIDPKKADAYNNSGSSLERLNRDEEAIECYKKSIDIDPSYAPAYSNWGWSLGKLGRHEEAIEQYSKAIEINSQFTLAYNNLGISLRKLGRHDDAIEQYKKAIEIDPKYADAYNNWGNCLRDLGRHKEATEQYKNAIEKNPKNSTLYNNLGKSLDKLGCYEEAIAQYKKAIEINPKYATAYDNWGSSLHNLHRYEEAIEQFEKAINIDPKHGESYGNWGWSLVQLKRIEDAIEKFDKVIEVDPQSIIAYTIKGVAYSHLGKLELAIASYSKALEIDSTNLMPCYFMTIAKKNNNSNDTTHYLEKFHSNINLSKNKSFASYALGGIAAIEGNCSLAIEMLRQIAQEDLQSFSELAQLDLAFESIRNAPEFQAIFQVVAK